MRQILPIIRPLNKSTDYKLFQGLTPVLIAAKEDIVFTIEEDYRDIIEPFFKGAAMSYRKREYRNNGTNWTHQEMEIYQDVPNIQKISKEFLKKGFHVTERKALTKQEVERTFDNVYAHVTVDEFNLCSINEVLEISCYIEGSLLEEAFCCSISTTQLEDILERLEFFVINADGELETEHYNFDNLYDWWETISFCKRQQRMILREGMKDVVLP